MIMRTHIRITCLLAIAIPCLLGGCFKLARQSPQLQLYVLSGGAPDGAPTATVRTSTASRGRLTIGLRQPNLASYLSRPSVMIRRGQNQLFASEFHRWGEDLDQGINLSVGTYLAGSPSVRTVNVAPWPTRVRHDFLVQLNILRFEGVADSTATAGRVHVMADWDIIRPLDGAVLIRGSSDDRDGAFRVGDYDGLVTGLDAALSRVARDIGACLARFPNDSTPPASCGSVSAGVRESGIAPTTSINRARSTLERALSSR